MISPLRYARRVRNSIRWKHWTAGLVCIFMMRSVAIRMGIATRFFNRWYERVGQRLIDRRFKEGDHWNIRGVRVGRGFSFLVFEDLFTQWAWFDGRYDSRTTLFVDTMTDEGDYCYDDGEVRVLIDEGDVVIDAGASVGEFSALAAHLGATCYAFEPVAERISQLEHTAHLNIGEKGKIIPVQLGLSDREGEVLIDTEHGSPTLLRDGNEKITLTTLDKFVEQNGLERVDFIKSDIEGAERDLLRGARETMRRFAPKLSICTYHLPDDPEVLEAIIREANPNYKIVQRRKKLVASV